MLRRCQWLLALQFGHCANIDQLSGGLMATYVCGLFVIVADRHAVELLLGKSGGEL